MSFLPRPLPSPHPNISQNSMRPSVPDISIMENECGADNYVEPLLNLFEKLLENDEETEEEDNCQYSIELPRKDDRLSRFNFDETKDSKRNERFVRKNGASTSSKEMSIRVDKFDISSIKSSDQSLNSPFSIHSTDLRFTTFSSSTPSSCQVRSFNFNADQFSPIPEERDNSDPDCHSIQMQMNASFPRDARKKNYSSDHHSSVKFSQKQNYHRNDVSMQMLQLGEKYLPKHNKNKISISNDSGYSLASAKYLDKFQLLPKNYKIKENDNNIDRSKAERSIETQQYMEKYGLVNKNIKHPNNDHNRHVNTSSSFKNILPKDLHGKKLT
uniref:Uncharacterized protein n=1 Tax=Strigamia maritima TaxID=126957 RepID=T1J1L6_STRMM